MAQIGYKGRIYRGGAAIADPYTQIPKARNITAPAPTRDKIDATNNDSANFTREFVQGFIDPGQVSFTCVYEHDDTTQHDILDDYLSGADTQCYWKIEIRNNITDALERTVTFPAFIGTASVSLETEALRELSVTLEVTGAVTIA
jgi:hypothetical protein